MSHSVEPTPSRLRASVVFSLLTACGGTTTEIPVNLVKYPEVQLSSDLLEFGTLDFGDSSSRIVVLRNTGDVALGIESIELRDEAFVDSFSLSWDEDDIVCPNDDVEDEDESSASRAAADTWDAGEGEGEGE
ncbi:MAG TPA: hypothetical protein DFR83_15055, partial [Deltaproteobacteria bacterium]|nr:hypothetical protein [Deltaproteobacteria bacterium]